MRYPQSIPHGIKAMLQISFASEQMAEAFSWSVDDSVDAVEINARTENPQNASSPSDA